MQANFTIGVQYTATGTIDDPVILETIGGTPFLGRMFQALVAPGRGFGGATVLRIDRFITISGPVLDEDENPNWHVRGGRKHFWLSEDNVPVWVREIALSIENTHVPSLVTPSPRILTEPK